ncbi:uncharacterized protein [Venturia canescens]|uniref:uncharacterized protein n=1 Tax=Venturia canescens TaxID=32260 RepID=UPI001C9CA5C1|nr:uncharacterized protein LOC122407234 [Venturia canescens]
MKTVSTKRTKHAAKKHFKKSNKYETLMKEIKKMRKDAKKQRASRRSRKRKRSAPTSSSSSSSSSYSSDSSTDSPSCDAESVQNRTLQSKVSFSDKENIAHVSRDLPNEVCTENFETLRKTSNRDEPVSKKRRTNAVSTSPIRKIDSPLVEKSDLNLKSSFNKNSMVKKLKIAESCPVDKNEDCSNDEFKTIVNKETSLVQNTLNTSLDKEACSVLKEVKKHQEKNYNEGNKDDCILDKSTRILSDDETGESLGKKQQDYSITDVAKKNELEQGISSMENNMGRREKCADGAAEFGAEKTSTPKKSDDQFNNAVNELTNKPIVQALPPAKVTTAMLSQDIADEQIEINDDEKNIEILRQLFGSPKKFVQVLMKIAGEFSDSMGINEKVLGSQKSAITSDDNNDPKNLAKVSNANEPKEDELMIVENESETKLQTTVPGHETLKDLEAIAECLVSKWSTIIDNSLDENVLVELLDKHLPPKNFPHLEVPTLNPQLKDVIDEMDWACDEGNASIQVLTASAMSAVGKALTMLLRDSAEFQDEKAKKLTNFLEDTGKILAHIFHIHLLSRRSKIIPKIREVFDSKCRKNLIDAIIFGKKFAQTWKNLETRDIVEITKSDKINAKIIEIDRSSLINASTMLKKTRPRSGKPKILDVQVLQKLPQTVDYAKPQVTSAAQFHVTKVRPRKTMTHSTPRYSPKEESIKLQTRLSQKNRKLLHVDSNASSETKTSFQNQAIYDAILRKRRIDSKTVGIEKPPVTMENLNKSMEMKKQKLLVERKSNDSMQQPPSSDEENFDMTEDSESEIFDEEEENDSEDDKETVNEELNNSTEKEQSDLDNDEECNSKESEATDIGGSRENIDKGKRIIISKQKEEFNSKDGNNSKEKEEDNSKVDTAEGCSKANEQDDSKQENKEDSTGGKKEDSSQVKGISVEEEIDSKEEQKRKVDKQHRIVLKHKQPEVPVTDCTNLNNANCSLKSTKDKQSSNSQEDCDSSDDEKQEEEKIHSVDKTESWKSCRSNNSSVNDPHASQTLQKSEKMNLEPASENQGQMNFPSFRKNNGPPHELLAKVMQIRLRTGKKLWPIHSLASGQETSNVSSLDGSLTNTPREPTTNELRELEKP